MSKVSELDTGALLLDKVKKLCADRNTSIPKLEKQLGFGGGSIYNWAEHSPSVDKVVAVANFFKIPLQQLLTNESQGSSVRRPISRLDANDSRLLKKEFLRLIRNRASIIRTLTDNDQAAVKLAESAASSQDEDFESDVESLIWKYVALQLNIQKGTTSHE